MSGCGWAFCASSGRIVWKANRAKAPKRPIRRNQARPHPAFAAAHTSQAFTDFATGLIAAKPEKPCDRAVFGAFYSLLKKERKQADTPALPFTGPRLRAPGQPSIGPLPGFHGPAAVADLGAAARRRGGQKTASFKASRQSLCRCLSASFPRSLSLLIGPSRPTGVTKLRLKPGFRCRPHSASLR